MAASSPPWGYLLSRRAPALMEASAGIGSARPPDSDVPDQRNEDFIKPQAAGGDGGRPRGPPREANIDYTPDRQAQVAETTYKHRRLIGAAPA